MVLLLLELLTRRRRHRPRHSRRQEEVKVEVGAGIGGMRGPAMGGGGQIKQVGSHSSLQAPRPATLSPWGQAGVESLHSCV